MARWRAKHNEGVPPELLSFEPDDWILGGRSSRARLQMALDRWYRARWDWVIADPNHRTIDGDDVIDILYERRENKAFKSLS
jgi:hypothetical protein